MVEKVEFTNLCMISDGNKVVVIDRKKEGLAWSHISRRSCRAGRIIFGRSNPRSKRRNRIGYILASIMRNQRLG